MTKANHSPAPWHYRLPANNQDAWEIVADFCESPLAEVPRWQDEAGNASEEATANRDAITAVPQLIAACRLVVERWDSGDLAEAAWFCQAALEQATGDKPARLRELDIDAGLASRREIAVSWCVEDVQGVRPHLSDDQAWEVLQEVKHHHDTDFGITWFVLENEADELYPRTKDGTTGDDFNAAEGEA